MKLAYIGTPAIAVPSRVEKLPEGVTYTMAADGTTKQWAGLSWEKLGQNPTMQAQWAKLGYTLESAADIITQPFDYTIDTAGVVITGVVIIGFFIFLIAITLRSTTRIAVPWLYLQLWCLTSSDRCVNQPEELNLEINSRFRSSNRLPFPGVSRRRDSA